MLLNIGRMMQPWAGAEFFTSLYLPHDFGVTFQRSSSRYRILEDGSHYLNDYLGSNFYVSTDGNDTTGTGSRDFPYATISKAITEASNDDRIILSPGEYAPANITKSVALIAPSGGAYIGTFNDLSGATITEETLGGRTWYEVAAIGGERVVGLVRTDANGADEYGLRGSATMDGDTEFNLYVDNDAANVVETISGASKVYLKGGASLIDEVAAGNIKAWLTDSTTELQIATGVTAYIGDGITIASFASDVVEVQGSGVLNAVGTHFYGGLANIISAPGTGFIRQFGTKAAGSVEDNFDYRGTVTAVESNVVCGWPGKDASDNASTGHDDCKVLRVGGTYRGGSRTVHDVNNTGAYVFSCAIGDALHGSKTLLLSGFSTISNENCTLDYGDITFLDTFGQGDLTNTLFDSEATVTNTGLGDAWPYSGIYNDFSAFPPLYYRNALNEFLADLESASILSKFDAIYDLGGPTKTDSSINLVNSGTFNLTENGTVNWTLGEGSASDGTTGWMDCGFAPNEAGTQYARNDASVHLFVDTYTSDYEFGLDGNDEVRLGVLRNDGVGGRLNSDNTVISTTPTTAEKFFSLVSLTRTDASTVTLYHNGTQVNQETSNSTAAEEDNHFAIFKSGSTIASSNSLVRLVAIGSSLTGTEVSDFYDAVNKFVAASGPRYFLLSTGGQSNMERIFKDEGESGSGSGDGSADSAASERVLIPLLQGYVDSQFTDGRTNKLSVVNSAEGGSGVIGSNSDTENKWWNNETDTALTLLTDWLDDVNGVWSSNTVRRGLYIRQLGWAQGEANVGSTASADFINATTDIFSYMRTNISDSNMKITIHPIGRNASSNTGVYNRRDDQQDMAEDDRDTYIGPETMDIERINANDWHATNDLEDGNNPATGYDRMAEYVARAAAFHFGCTSVSWRGPEIVSAEKVDSTTIDVTIRYPEGCSGDDFTPTTGVVGFRIVDDTAERTISSAVRQDATTIRLTTSTAIGANPTVAYDNSNGGLNRLNMVRDNAAFPMPMAWSKFIDVDTGASFSPDDISSLTLWLDADDATTITDTSGAVDTWSDKSGNSNDLSSGSNPPATGSNTINGKNAITFDGTNDVVAASGPIFTGTSETSQLSIFVVANVAGGEAGYLFSNAGDGTGFGLYYNSTPNVGLYDGTGSADSISRSGGTELVTVLYDQDTVTFRVDGTAGGTDADDYTFNAATNTFALGNRPGGSSGATYLAGDVAEIIIYEKILTSSEIADVETYLADKWGITI